MAIRAALPLLLCSLCLNAQVAAVPAQATVSELSEALSRTAANFALTAPGLEADETLDQRGRRGFIEVLKGKVPTARNSELKLPDEFQSHHVISRYRLAPSGSTGALHETRDVLEIDGVKRAGDPDVRHAMTIGILSPDDEQNKRTLESFEHAQLEGAVTDFGQVILLFTKERLADYQFSALPDTQRDGKPALVLGWRQTGGAEGLTLFQQRTEDREMMEGEILFEPDDLLPVRITLRSRKPLSKTFFLQTDATVDYTPSPFGLVPAHVDHLESLNAFPLVENDLRYANYRRPGPKMVP